MGSQQAVQDQIMPALARVRSALDDVRGETQQTAAEHELMAAWHARRGEVDAERMEHRAGAVQQQRLADLDAAFEALDRAVFAALDLDP
jgi:hypothetical protein